MMYGKILLEIYHTIYEVLIMKTYIDRLKELREDNDLKQADIAKYGLYTYEDFADYVTYEQFIAFNGPYLKVLVGRGVLTYEQILELIATYVK